MAFLRGFGKYLPERVVGNAEIGAQIGAEPSWIHEMSGIEERRFARAGETVAEMAAAAGKDALERSGVGAEELGLILVSSGSAERRFPGPASEVQHRLGAAQAIAIDVPMASAGALFALAQAEMWAARVGKVLVVAAEKMSEIALTPPIEKGTAMLFGDGAGAVLVDRDQGVARMVDFELGSDGASALELRLDFNAPVYMNGRMVIMHAARKVPAAILAVLRRAGLEASDVHTFLMHQANSNLITRIAQTLGVEGGKFYSNIARYGNTSSASMLIAACEWDHHFAAGDQVVFAAFGAGFQWGALLVEGV
ncbi:3-oxoacyl-ACP synthase III family protein [Bryobacter aggregatus]|uniref:3-oxoacyl-ACP synthase III family protein n=1 Tax=Bryobacter aggregatus TaxID=360054 RepID=UPI0004E11D4A|nr:ketoacyl-ACP synthase III [Bryobacter aggregatus]